MRTTIDLPLDLLSAAKQRAAESGLTLSQVVADALRRSQAASSTAPPVRLVASGLADGSAPTWEDIRRLDADGDRDRLHPDAFRVDPRHAAEPNAPYQA